MKYYHATTEETMEKIFTDGAIRKRDESVQNVHERSEPQKITGKR